MVNLIYIQAPSGFKVGRRYVNVNDINHYSSSNVPFAKTIQDLKAMMIERLKQWSRMNSGTWPDSVLLYRSGICESQVAQINELELLKIRQSFKECGAGLMYNPKITIITVSKRHHTHVYPTSIEHADRTGNVTPGMVEHRVVVSPHSFSFFLQSHAAVYLFVCDHIALGRWQPWHIPYTFPPRFFHYIKKQKQSRESSSL